MRTPKAVTLVLSGYPEIQASMSAILMQADEILMKPVGLNAIAEIIRTRLAKSAGRTPLLSVRLA
jgi:ActR/RegA family two-component response regulator